MAVSFAATLVDGPVVVGVNRKRARIQLTLPSSFTGTGHAIDLSATALGGFNFITNSSFGPDGAATDPHQGVLSLTGTYDATVDAYEAATMLVQNSRGTANVGDAFDNSNTDDVSARGECLLTVEGW